MDMVEREQEAARLVGRLSLEEKVALLSGKDFWTTKSFEGIPSITMTDGPHGVRKTKPGSAIDGYPATCFPTASALAATWNPELLHAVGEAIGIEAQSMDVQVVLGPGINMKRSPLAGRNFEYFSEDPYLTAQMAIAHINGLQSQGVGASLKHFAANNQEYERMVNSSDIDERTLHEIYLRAFELTVKQTQPWSLMASYNLINGTRATESTWLLQDILRDTWGHTGIVVSDWMAAAIGRPAAVRAGTHLEMPGGSLETTKDILAAIKDGSLKESVVTQRAIELTANILKVARSKREGVTYDTTTHHALARKVAGEAIVLLKNDRHLLPLIPGKQRSIALVGLFAKEPRFQGGGSSQITPTHLDTLYDELVKIYGDEAIHYSPGYRADGTVTDHLLQQAQEVARGAEVTIIVTGLPTEWEFEGVDRPTLNLPDDIEHLIHEVAGVASQTVLSITNGAAIAMPWLERVHAVLEGWLTGQAGAGAMADIISGAITPSGRLSETFPQRIQDTPPYPDFPNKTGHARYSEGIFVGYRWYDTREIEPLFPFGYGLSYTTFEYGQLKLDHSSMYDDESVELSITVKNTGKYTAKEVVQLYLSHHDESEVHPIRELKKFCKVELGPGERKTVRFSLSGDDLSFYSEVRHAWHLQPGLYTVSIGRSSRDIVDARVLTVVAREPEGSHITHDSLLKDLAQHPRGRRIYELLSAQMAKAMGPPEHGKQRPDYETLLALVGDLPIARLPAISSGLITRDFVDAVVTYCTHERGFHPIESFGFYKEVAALIFRALRRR